jgi:outer membrane protein assembly factor BamB
MMPGMKLLSVLFVCAVSVHAKDWPQWRGPNANGYSADATPPVKWDEQTNVRWKTPLPGRGHSTPVIWGDTIFLTTAVVTDKVADPATAKAAEEGIGPWMKADARVPRNVVQFVVLAVDRKDGRVRWRKTVCEEVPRSGTHADASWASGSTIADGKRVYAYFGSQGLYCLDLQGNVQWQQRFGHMKTRASFGEGSTPVLHGDTLIVNWDQEGPSFTAALDRKTGAEKWKVERDEVTSWATPLVTEYNGKLQVITSATKRIRSYDFATGKLLWECGGMTGNVIPTPVRFGDTVIALSGFRGAAGLAIKLTEATGDITEKPAAFAWKLSKDTPYTPSPVLSGDRLYFLKVNEGSVSCVNARTGEPHFTGQVLEGTKRIYASLVAAAGKVYLTGTDGVTHVVKDGPQFELLATNKLADKFTASAALAGSDLILRGEKHLYCLGERKP